MDFSLVYLKNKRFVEKSIGEEKVLVPLTDNVADMNHVFTLNEVGTFIYDQLDGETSLQQIHHALLNEYEVDVDNAKTDIELFVLDAVEKGVIKKV